MAVFAINLQIHLETSSLQRENVPNLPGVIIIIIIILWRGVAWRGVTCSVYEAFGLVPFVAFRVFVVFMGHWGGTLVAFTALVVFMGH